MCGERLLLFKDKGAYTEKTSIGPMQVFITWFASSRTNSDLR